MKKNWFKYLVYISLIFLVIALVRADYLIVPHIFNHTYLGISFLLLFVGFLTLCLRWNVILNVSGYHVKTADAIASSGLSVFAKYIPGKVFMVIGKVGYINKKYAYKNDKLFTYSVFDQILAIWTAILFSLFSLNYLKNFQFYVFIAALIWMVLLFFIFSNAPYIFVQWLINKISGRSLVVLPRIHRLSTLRVIPVHLLYWLIMSSAFYFLIASLSSSVYGYDTGFIFPVAVSFGILVLIAPGGLGIRETILVGYLTAAGMEIDEAVTISVASRLWFLTGEVFVFLSGLVADRLSKN
ncbi:MAG: lysylphosphatidylglycerol synthase domain-containing protein [Bacteroidales bacterium]